MHDDGAVPGCEGADSGHAESVRRAVSAEALPLSRRRTSALQRKVVGNWRRRRLLPLPAHRFRLLKFLQQCEPVLVAHEGGLVDAADRGVRGGRRGAPVLVLRLVHDAGRERGGPISDMRGSQSYRSAQDWAGSVAGRCVVMSIDTARSEEVCAVGGTRVR